MGLLQCDMAEGLSIKDSSPGAMPPLVHFVICPNYAPISWCNVAK